MKHDFTTVGRVAGARGETSHRGERFYRYCRRCKAKLVGRYAEGECQGKRTHNQARYAHAA